NLARAGFWQPGSDLNQIRRRDRADLSTYPVTQLFYQLVAGLFAAVQGDVHIDTLAFNIVRITHHRSLSHFRVRYQRAFYFSGTHTVAGYVNNVVHTAGNPVVTVFITTGTVTGEIHTTEGREIGLHIPLMVTVHGTGLARPAVNNHQVTFGRAFQNHTGVIHQRRLHTKERTGSRTGFGIGCARQRGNHDAAGFSLPP